MKMIWYRKQQIIIAVENVTVGTGSRTVRAQNMRSVALSRIQHNEFWL
jgi:hypothetical protein